MDKFVAPIYESLNFEVQPGERSCFFDTVDLDVPGRNIEVFVHSAGDIEVLLTIHGPLKYEDMIHERFENPIQSETVKSQDEKNSDTQTYKLEFTAHDHGDYAFCLDNRHARFFAQFVEFDMSHVIPKKVVRIGNEDPLLSLANSNTTSEARDLLHSLAKIHKGIVKIQRQAIRDRHRLTLHRDMNTHNYSHAFYGSVFETVVFIVVSLFQIYFVRRWFASKTKKPVK